jgi:hypothetical protein
MLKETNIDPIGTHCKCLETRKVTAALSSPKYEIVTNPNGTKTAIMRGFNCDICGLPRNAAVEINDATR